MSISSVAIPLDVARSLNELGRNIRTARLRRKLSLEDVASKALIDRKTLSSLELGRPGVAIGNVLCVLWVLGLLPQMQNVAAPDRDEHGKLLELARQGIRARREKPDNDF